MNMIVRFIPPPDGSPGHSMSVAELVLGLCSEWCLLMFLLQVIFSSGFLFLFCFAGWVIGREGRSLHIELT